MSTPALRPTFSLVVPLSPEAAVARLESHAAQPTCPVVAQRAGLHMTLTVRPAQRHFWSPWMSLEFNPAEPEALPRDETTRESAAPTQPDEPATKVHARFSPAPSIWTGFMMLYITLASAAFFAAMFAAAQWMMGRRPTLLWGVLACGVLIGLLWWVSRVGQKLAHDQMHLLRQTVERELARSAPAG